MKSELLMFGLNKSVSGAAFSATKEQVQESPLSSFFFWEPLGQQEPEACEAWFSGEKAQQQAGLAIAKTRKTAMKILRLTSLRIFG
ncbi:MAG: hypothetical protein ACSHX7_00085 [Luteolibacter sp.]